MAIDRRGFLLGAAALPLAPRDLYLAACGLDGGQYGLSALTAAGDLVWTRTAPARGHGLCLSPDRRLAALCARRPGDFVLFVSPSSGSVEARVTPHAGLRFNGHGVFSADGTRFFATCTRDADDSGWIGVHARAQHWRAVAAWPTHGGDPHEILRLGDALIVANGGLPGGKTPVDAGEVETSLVAIDARDGRLTTQARPPMDLRTISLRHMIAIDRTVYVAGQEQEAGADSTTLLAAWEGGALRYFATPDLDGYCGSIVAQGGQLCLTSPKAGRAYLLSPGEAPAAEIALVDVCGAAPDPVGGFVLTGGRGDVRRSRETAGIRVNGRRWDNHAILWQV